MLARVLHAYGMLTARPLAAEGRMRFGGASGAYAYAFGLGLAVAAAVSLL